jgi:RHS repeat-associated protein
MFAHQASGLYLTLNRAYDPYSGRWLSRDPIGEHGGINQYVYAGDDPVNFVDRTGKDPLIGATVGGIAGAIYGGFGAAATSGASWKSIAAGAFAGGFVGAGIGALDPSLGIGTLAVVGGVVNRPGFPGGFLV